MRQGSEGLPVPFDCGFGSHGCQEGDDATEVVGLRVAFERLGVSPGFDHGEHRGVGEGLPQSVFETAGFGAGERDQFVRQVEVMGEVGRVDFRACDDAYHKSKF